MHLYNATSSFSFSLPFLFFLKKKGERELKRTTRRRRLVLKLSSPSSSSPEKKRQIERKEMRKRRWWEARDRFFRGPCVGANVARLQETRQRECTRSLRLAPSPPRVPDPEPRTLCAGLRDLPATSLCAACPPLFGPLFSFPLKVSPSSIHHFLLPCHGHSRLVCSVLQQLFTITSLSKR